MNQKESTRALLVEAAIEVFSRQGYQKARVSDIVSRAGVAQGTFYLYFSSKEAVFRHICTLFMERFSLVFERTSRLFEGKTVAEVEARVASFLQELLMVYRENLQAAEVLFREGIGHGGLFKEVYEDIFAHFLKLIEDRVRVSLERGIFRFEDPETAAIFLLGLFERSVFYYLFLKEKLDVDKLARHMAAFILHGLDLHQNPLEETTHAD